MPAGEPVWVCFFCSRGSTGLYFPVYINLNALSQFERKST